MRLRRAGPDVMSWQLGGLNLVLRFLVKPRINRTTIAEHAALAFARGAKLFRHPPFVRFLAKGAPRLNWISAGPTELRKVVLYFHGGGYVAGSAATHQGMLARLSKLAGVEVCAPDYRLAQEAPFPAAYDDAVAAWLALRALGYRPQDIILGGDSAGGGLMLALLAYLCQTGETPRGAFAFSPWTDLTLGGGVIAGKPSSGGYPASGQDRRAGRDLFRSSRRSGPACLAAHGQVSVAPASFPAILRTGDPPG